MDKIYSNAIINIVAAHSLGPAESFFAPRTTGGLKTIQIQWCPGSNDERSTYQIDKQAPYPLAHSISQVGKIKLFKRGWVVQETVLSRRMLVFDGPDICWMCLDENSTVRSWALEHPFWTLTFSDDLLQCNSSSSSTP